MQPNLIFAQIFSGITYGSIYGLFALSIVFLYRANRLFNLATTEIATIFTMLMFFLLNHMSYFAAFILVLILSFFGGIFLHLILMRAVTEKKNVLHSNETVVTIGLYTMLNSLSSYVFSDEAVKFPTPFHQTLFPILGNNIPSHFLVIIGATVLIVISLFLFLRFTRLGLIMEATSENITGARLRGINTSNVLALAWGLATTLSVLAGILIAPVMFLSPGMLINTFSYALIAVVIGGLESPFGAVAGGILVGVVENLSTNIPLFGSELKFPAVFLFLILIMIIRPRGLWGRIELRRV